MHRSPVARTRRTAADRLRVATKTIAAKTIATQDHEVVECFVADLLTLDVEKPTAGGRMLARHNGQIVLVWGAIPGERVRARVERKGKGVLFAETTDVLSASPHRRDAAADWRCGGNVFAHVAYDRQLQLKSEIIRDAFTRIGRLPLDASPPLTASPEQGYRMRARLHVRGGRIGFVREGSHDVCAVGQTGQLLPETVSWIEAVEDSLRSDSLSGLASIEIAENIPASERAVHLELEPGLDPRRFAVLATDVVTGLSAQVLDRRSVSTLTGTSSVSDAIGSLRLRRDARAFFQGNRFLHRVSALAPDGPVVDLYAGVGLFGLSLAAARGAQVTLVEGDAISGRDLEENAKPYADCARVIHTSVEDFLRHDKPTTNETFIVDPPRTGMSADAVRAIAALKPARIIYVSCDVATLARDARVLVDADYSLGEVSGMDLFPNTAHVETICVFISGGR
jgi:23S rRNA (uracil1939-C5)-methyltransferase